MGRKTQIKLEEKFSKIIKFDEFLKSHAPKVALTPAQIDQKCIDELTNYKSLFINDPKTRTIIKSSNKEKRMKLLVRHCFNKYKVPSHMYEAWNSIPKFDNRFNAAPVNKSALFKEWYFCIAQGGSFYKQFGRDLKLTKAESHNFLTVDALTIQEGLWAAVAIAAGASKPFAQSIAKTKINEKEITNEFWKHVAIWFAHRESEKVSVSEMNDLIDYINSRKIAVDQEQNRIAAINQVAGIHYEKQVYSLNGITVETIVKRTHDWHRELARNRTIGGGTWQGHGIADSTFTTGKAKDGTLVTWTFNQILTGNELAEEGNRQRHCVGSYKQYCMDGLYSIWSLKRNGVRALTIQVNNAGEIVQHRGIGNRAPRPDEANIVRAWAKDAGLTVKNGYW